MNKSIIHFFGIFMVFIGACLCLPLIVALVYKEFSQAGAFLISIAICLVPGIFVRLRYKSSVTDEKLGLRDSYLLVAVAWILASVFGCIPFLLTGTTDSFFLAFFETASGFSTTGATIFSHVEDLPHCILMWRALTQWLGGMGMIVLFFAMLPKFGITADTISQAETPGPIQKRITSRYSDTAGNLYIMYIALTLACFLLLLLGGMNVFDALAHAFTTLATGGFSTHTGGLSYFNSPFIYAVIGVFAFIAGSNFTLFFDILAGRIKQAVKDEEFRFYVIIILVSAVLIAINFNMFSTFDSLGKNIGVAIFSVVNTISTLGFEGFHVEFPPFVLLVLVALMMMGGCSSSTAGGIKVSRILILFKALKKETNRRILGTQIGEIKYNNKRMSKKSTDFILTFVILFVLVVSIATIIISAFGGGDVLNNLISVLSCIGNQGPAFDNLGLPCTYFTDSWICVITYVFVMIAGRLEIATVLILFSKHFWHPNRA